MRALESTASSTRWPVLTGDQSKTLFYCFVIAINLLYLFVDVHTPITVYPGAPHDDTLFMTLGEHLVRGEWLGPYSQFTLLKGPGYPAFLALNSLLGTPVTLSTALLNCFAATFFVLICHRFVRSYVLSGLLLTLLLWHPIALSVFLRRVFRDSIYYSQLLLFLAATCAALISPPSRRYSLWYAALAGACLGWFWLTREEGVWIIPGCLIVVTAAVMYAVRDHQLRIIAEALVVLGVVFGGIQIGFMSVNKWVYGSFVGVDFKEANYQRALRAIHSVRSGGIEPYISITPGARQRVYAVSPAFASLKDYLEGLPGQGWGKISCIVYKEHCADLGVGFFIFAVRDAASSRSYYATPGRPSTFWGQVAGEINAACASKALECAPQLISEMPQVSWRQIADRLPAYYSPSTELLLFLNPLQQIGGSAGDEENLPPRLRFLNYPLHTKSPDITAARYTLSGWYYKKGNAWFTAKIEDTDGADSDLRIERAGSPDIQAYTKDAEADRQRFTVHLHCGDNCVLQIVTPVGKAEKKVSEIRAPFDLLVGGGQFHLDSASAFPNPAYVKTPVELLCQRIREFVLKYYQFLFVPLLMLSLCLFLVTSLICGISAVANVPYMLALTSFALVLSRIGLLVIMGVTSNTAVVLSPNYVVAAYYSLACGAVLSISAFMQLIGLGRLGLWKADPIASLRPAPV